MAPNENAAVNLLAGSELNTDSIEVSTNAKGGYQYCAKVYFGVTKEELDRAFQRLADIDARFRANYQS